MQHGGAIAYAAQSRCTDQKQRPPHRPPAFPTRIVNRWNDAGRALKVGCNLFVGDRVPRRALSAEPNGRHGSVSVVCWARIAAIVQILVAIDNAEDRPKAVLPHGSTGKTLPSDAYREVVLASHRLGGGRARSCALVDLSGLRTPMRTRLIDLRAIEYAKLAGEYRSFRRTADILGVSQSEISRKISYLEGRLGISLFERTYRGSSLTEAGAEFLSRAEAGLEILGSAVEAAANWRRGHGKALRVGIVASLSQGFLRDLLTRYGRFHPDSDVSVFVGDFHKHITSLINGVLDVAFLPGEPEIEGLTTLPLWSEELLIALPSGHPRASDEKVALHSIFESRFLVSRGVHAEKVSSFLATHVAEFTSRPDVITHDLPRDDLLHLVAIGQGVVLTCFSGTGLTPAGVIFRPLQAPTSITSSAIWSPNNTRPNLSKMISLARSISDEYRLPP